MATAAAGPSLAQDAAAEPLQKARDQVQRAIDSMEKVDLEMSAEPAFIFKP